MHKNELIQLHTLLCQIKHHFEARDSEHFDDYEQVGVQPTHVHRSKSDHKKAIFVLGKELASKLSSDEFSNPGRVSSRFEEIVGQMDRQPAKATH